MTLVPAYTTIPAFPDPTAELSAHQGARPPILAFAGEPRTSLALERAYPGISRRFAPCSSIEYPHKFILSAINRPPTCA